MSRIRVFSGHFGSGKTEIAINYAINLAKSGNKVAIVDMDIVNPYFCVRDLKDYLEKKEIKVISSSPKFSNAELMVLPPEVLSAFNDKSYEVIIDVGGDDVGAVALGQYNKYFQEEPYDMYFVINNNRPMTEDFLSTEEYMINIERASRLRITHLISNTNLSSETNVQDILDGDKIVSELSKQLKIPYRYTVITKDLEDEVRGKVAGELFTINIYMKKPWEQ